MYSSTTIRQALALGGTKIDLFTVWVVHDFAEGNDVGMNAFLHDGDFAPDFTLGLQRIHPAKSLL
jgi:hypothetical protein